MNEIEAEITRNIPLVGSRVPLQSLLVEYAIEDTVYRSKIANLCKSYDSLRKTRPDGNCFYRAFAFAYFEILLTDADELRRFRSVVDKVKTDLESLGLTGFTVDDFHDNFVDVLEQ